MLVVERGRCGVMSEVRGRRGKEVPWHVTICKPRGTLEGVIYPDGSTLSSLIW